ncbi:MAG: lipid-A-disaccharide synthase [Pigmentiphaga sp.]|nr:lipid-A-disaccharide synthase [Pigmentiphaga sp.]
MRTAIGMVAGEPSGDLLAARVIAGLKASGAEVATAGIGGPRMREAGFDAWYPMDRLSVFGYLDALRRLPWLLAMRRDVRRRWLAEPPAAFVGIDAPDFNLGLEAALRARGIPTVHFVGPSIWAWRGERIHAIREAVSHMLVVFPFEVDIYRQAGIPVTYVGHPLAPMIPRSPDRAATRARLGVPLNERVVAMLPGSRAGEITHLGPRFIAAAQHMLRRAPDLRFLVPMVNAQRQAQFEAMLPATGLPLRCVPQGAYDVLEASDVVLVASGTATLETALFKRPMVIAYAVSPLALWLMRRKSGQERPYLPWVGLPNILCRDFVVPELLQDAATPEALAEAVLAWFEQPQKVATLEARFAELHEALSRDTPRLAAEVIQEVARHGAR